MVNCRSIPEEAWTKAYERLVFYFSRKHQAHNAQDLAQETLSKVWSRSDFEFEKEEDFFKVCIGFARHVSFEEHRESYRYSGGEVNPNLPGRPGDGAAGTEFRILLDQVLNAAESRLPEHDYQSILQAIQPESDLSATGPEANRRRVYRHRAIRKLAQVLGLSKGIL